jgi:hypothetical protein
MSGDVIDIQPWLSDRRPRRQVAQDLAAREGISVAQAMLLLCVAGHETERAGGGSRRRAPRRLSASRPEPVAPAVPTISRRVAELLDRLGPDGDGGRIATGPDGTVTIQWEPGAGVSILVTLAEGAGAVVRARHPRAGDTHWDLDDRGIEYLRVALQRLVSR